MWSINSINGLLKDLENQVTISQDQASRNAPISSLEGSLNVLKDIHQKMINAFASSSAARISVFKLFGEKMRMNDDVLTYSKNVIYNLAAIIQHRKRQ